MTVTRPAIKAVLLDETEFWDDAFLEAHPEIESIRAIYVYDETRHVHACELTPSYELHFAGHDVAYQPWIDTNEDDIDQVDSEIKTEPNEPVCYIHIPRDGDLGPYGAVAQVNAPIDNIILEEYANGDIDHNELIDEAIEEVNANWPFGVV